MTTFVDHEYCGVDVTRTWDIFEELKQYLRQICYTVAFASGGTPECPC